MCHRLSAVGLVIARLLSPTHSLAMGTHWNFPRHLANPRRLRTGSLFRQEKCAFDRSELCLFLIHVNHRFTLIICLKGASAVLIYGAMDSPLAQPRALVGGHFLGALTGICITKLFHLLPTEKRFQSLLWLAGSLSCATSVIVMHILNWDDPPTRRSDKPRF